MTGPPGEAVPGLADQETKNVKGSEPGYQRRDPAINTIVQVRAHRSHFFVFQAVCYLVFTCYVSASSGVFVKIDLFRSNMGDADESVIFELGRHAVIIGLIERNTCKGNFIPFRLERLYNDAVRYCDNIHGVSVLLSHFCTPNLPLHRPLSVFHRLLARLSHFCRPHV